MALLNDEDKARLGQHERSLKTGEKGEIGETVKVEGVEGNILEEANVLTSETRRATYGHPLDDYTCTASIITALLISAKKIAPTEVIEPELAAAIQIAVKLSRLSRNLQHRDSILDMAGYARVIELIIQERNNRWANYKGW